MSQQAEANGSRRSSRESSRPGRLVRLPLVPPALAMILGIAVSTQIELQLEAWLLAAATMLALALPAQRYLGNWATGAAILAGVFSTSGALARLQLHSVPRGHVSSFVGRSQLTTLRGTVVSLPEVHSPVTSWQQPQTSFLLEAGAIRTGPDWTKTTGLVRVSVEGVVQDLPPGTRVKVLGRSGRYGPRDNPGQFDPVARAQLEDVFLWCRAPAPEAVKRLGPGRLGPLRRHLGRLRAMTRSQLLPETDQPGDSLVQAMVVGHRSRGLARLNDLMRRSGAGHFLSISGLHLSVLLGLAYLLCRLAMLTRRTSAVVVLIVLGLFLLVAQPRPGLLRSAVMAAVLCVGIISARPASALNALAAAAIVLLALDPAQLLRPGFQMSFAIVAVLLLLMNPMKQFLLGRYLKTRGLRVFRDDQAWKRWLYMRGPEIAGDYLCLSILAYLAAAPLTAWHFQIFSPYAILLSLVFFPIVAAVLIPGYLSIGLAWLAPNLADRLAEGANASAHLLAGMVEMLEYLPLLSIDLYPISFWVAAGWLGSAMLLVWALGNRKLRWAAVSAGAMTAAALAVSQMPAPAPETANLYVLDVGAGQTALLRTPSGSTALFDAGGPAGSQVYARVLRPFVLDGKLPWPEVAFVSHGNADHYTALLDLLDRRALRTLYVSRHFGLEDPDGGEALLLRKLARSGGKLIRLQTGDVVELDDRTRVEVLWPDEILPEDLPRRENETSLVLRIVCDNRSVLLPGDAQSFAQSALLDRHPPAPEAAEELACDAMLLPHHGSWDATLPLFVSRINPQIVLASRSGPLPASGQAGSFYADLISTRIVRTTSRDGCLLLRFGYGVLEAVSATAGPEP